MIEALLLFFVFNCFEKFLRKMPKEQNICLPLPNSLSSNIVSSEWREKYLERFLENQLPSSDKKGIQGELEKHFKLDKSKSKKKKLKKTRKNTFYSYRKCITLGLNESKKWDNLLYSDIVPLNNMWQGYMTNLLGVHDFAEINLNPANPNYESISQRLMKADYHGAEIKVIRSKCPSLVGIRGIIFQDTKNLFRVISQNNCVRSIPKEPSVFSIYFGDTILDIEGRDFCFRPAERATKKLKSTNINIL